MARAKRDKLAELDPATRAMVLGQREADGAWRTMRQVLPTFGVTFTEISQLDQQMAIALPSGVELKVWREKGPGSSSFAIAEDRSIVDRYVLPEELLAKVRARLERPR